MGKRIHPGEQFGKLTALEHVSTAKNGAAYWSLICDCGNKTTVRASHLRAGDIYSCGCVLKNRLRTHGLTHTPIYVVWQNMRNRCYKKTNNSYEDYGARGITVCDRWKNSFENFYSDMGDIPAGKSIDRIDNNKGYSPENCKWSTRLEQQSNRRSNVRVAYRGVEKTLQEWAREFGFSYQLLYGRLYHGWNIEKALLTPVGNSK
jgi:hypothetical protein